MSVVKEDADRWLVSARANGEVLTTRAVVPGLELLLLGRPEGYTPAELASWVQSLAQSVKDHVAATPPGDPVPPMLREALGGLLFSRAELWNRGREPCAIALVASGDRIGFGWVGEASVEVYLDGARDGSEWVSIRDAHGNAARAWCASPRHDVRIELAWSPGPPLDVVRVEARWATERSSDVEGTVEAMPARNETEDEPGATTSAPLAPEAPSSGVARWLSQRLGWGRSATPGEAETGSVEDEAPPRRAAEMEASISEPSIPIDDLVEAFTDEISESIEPETSDPVTDLESLEPSDLDDLPPEFPERIPPTPEPESVTARAIALPPATAAGSEPAFVPEPSPGAMREVIEERATEEEETTVESLDAIATLSEPEGHAEPAPRRAPPRQPDWPVMAPSDQAARNWKVPVLWGSLVLVLFGIGWIVGSFQGQGGPEETRKPSSLVLFLRQIGLAPQRFEVAVTSRPPGAWIAVDGKDLSVKAPAHLQLAPGEHRVELSFPDLGSAPYLVRGAKNDRVLLDAPMWGSLDVVASDAHALVNVSVDGEQAGFVPIHIDSIAPGPHELRFSGPGMASWGSTIEVRVGESREVLAYPLQSPATGLLQIRATQAADGESAPLDGAHVWVDGVVKGVTPLTLELPRGPHSVRVVYQKEEAPIQVIDLPGGNQRFATFEFGLHAETPTLTLQAPAVVTLDEPALISATLSDVAASEVREMWLHVRSPDNRWRRYPMTMMEAQGSVVGAAPFPVSLLGEDGEQRYYVSAMTTQGDEIFTEMQTARGPAKVRR